MAPKAGPNLMVLVLMRVIGIGIETADMLVKEILSRNMRDRRAVAHYGGPMLFAEGGSTIYWCAPVEEDAMHGPGCPPGTACRTAHRSDRRVLPSLWHAMPSEASAHFLELVGSHQSPRALPLLAFTLN
jgi:hypothetical protein